MRWPVKRDKPFPLPGLDVAVDDTHRHQALIVHVDERTLVIQIVLRLRHPLQPVARLLQARFSGSGRHGQHRTDEEKENPSGLHARPARLGYSPRIPEDAEYSL